MLQDAWSPRKSDVEPGQLPARRVAHVNAHTRVLHNNNNDSSSNNGNNNNNNNNNDSNYGNDSTDRKGGINSASMLTIPFAITIN